jgi:hypothetical protein
VYVNITKYKTKQTRSVYLKYSNDDLYSYFEKYEISLTGVYKQINKSSFVIKFNMKSEKYDYLNYNYNYPVTDTFGINVCFDNFERNSFFYLFFLILKEELEYFILNVNNHKISKFTFDQFLDSSHNIMLIHYKISREIFEKNILSKYKKILKEHKIPLSILNDNHHLHKKYETAVKMLVNLTFEEVTKLKRLEKINQINN